MDLSRGWHTLFPWLSPCTCSSCPSGTAPTPGWWKSYQQRCLWWRRRRRKWCWTGQRLLWVAPMACCSGVRGTPWVSSIVLLYDGWNHPQKPWQTPWIPICVACFLCTASGYQLSCLCRQPWSHPDQWLDLEKSVNGARDLCIVNKVDTHLHQTDPFGWHQVCNLWDPGLHCPIIFYRGQLRNAHVYHLQSSVQHLIHIGGKGGVDVLLRCI